MKFTKKYLQNLDNGTWIKIRDAEEQVLCKALRRLFNTLIRFNPEYTHTLNEVFEHMSIHDDDIFYSLTEKE